MARINIEDSLFKEKAFEKLMFKLGSKRLALGALVESFALAQEYYLKSENHLIPIDAWNREEIGFELIECGFAHVEGDFVRVRGAETQFNWLVKCQKSGIKGGINSGKSRRSKGPEGFPRVPKGSEPSSSSSSSKEVNTNINTKNNTVVQSGPRKATPETNFDFESIYQNYPLHKGKTEGFKRCRSQIKTIDDFNNLKQAVEKYKTICVRDGTEKRYIKHFSSFMSSWKDWLDHDAGEVVGIKPKLKSPSQDRTDALRDQYERVQRGEL
jgi:hypothetical protein